MLSRDGLLVFGFRYHVCFGVVQLVPHGGMTRGSRVAHKEISGRPFVVVAAGFGVIVTSAVITYPARVRQDPLLWWARIAGFTYSTEGSMVIRIWSAVVSGAGWFIVRTDRGGRIPPSYWEIR